MEVLEQDNIKISRLDCTCEKFLNDLKENLFSKFSFLHENKYFFN